MAPDGDEPAWRMPEIPEWADDTWEGYEKRSCRVRMHVQELAENVPDATHFLYMHETAPMPKAIGEIDGAIYRQKTAVELGEGAEMAFYQTPYGLGLIWLRNEDAGPKTLFLTAPTPVDEQNVEIRVSYLFEGGGPPGAAEQFLELMDDQFEADTRIWENKIYSDPKPSHADRISVAFQALKRGFSAATERFRNAERRRMEVLAGRREGFFRSLLEGNLMNPGGARDPPSTRTLRCEISPQLRLCLAISRLDLGPISIL